MSPFRLVLALHTPIILPVVPPRLDVLLNEAMCRLDQDWTTQHELPLTFDTELGGYRVSQLIMGITQAQPLQAVETAFGTSPSRLPLAEASKPPRKLKTDGGIDAPRLNRHQGYLSPYAIFYGEGDRDQCQSLLGLLSGIGREHARHAGAFSVRSATDDASQSWRIRPWPQTTQQSLPFEPVPDQLSLMPGHEAVPVLRPPRLVREVIG